VTDKQNVSTNVLRHFFAVSHIPVQQSGLPDCP
jgi:hypothetical protein